MVIRLTRPAASIVATDLLGQPLGDGGAVEIAGNEIRFSIPPWKIVNLRIDHAMRQ